MTATRSPDTHSLDALAPLPSGAAAWIAAERGATVTRVGAIPPGAGARRYWRAWLADGRSVVLMHAVPEDPRILPPALRDAGTGIPFVEVTAFLRDLACPVPEIFAVDLARRWVLLEDLGTTRLCDLTSSEQQHRHEQAIDLLAHLHGQMCGTLDGQPRATDALPLRRRYDAEWIAFELELALGLASDEGARAALRARARPLVDYIAALPVALSFRDYQSQNLMVDPAGRLRVIDYQDAFLAPAALDLAALLHDSYVSLDRRARADLLARYATRARREVGDAELAAVVLHRKAKDASRYILMIEERGRREFAPYLVRAVASIEDAVEHVPRALADCAAALSALVCGARSAYAAGGSAACMR